MIYNRFFINDHLTFAIFLRTKIIVKNWCIAISNDSICSSKTQFFVPVSLGNQECSYISIVVSTNVEITKNRKDLKAKAKVHEHRSRSASNLGIEWYLEI